MSKIRDAQSNGVRPVTTGDNYKTISCLNIYAAAINQNSTPQTGVCGYNFDPAFKNDPECNRLNREPDNRYRLHENK